MAPSRQLGRSKCPNTRVKPHFPTHKELPHPHHKPRPAPVLIGINKGSGTPDPKNPYSTISLVRLLDST